MKTPFLKKTIFSLFFLSFFISNAQWRQLGNNLNGNLENDQFGVSVDLNADGDKIAIGAPQNFGDGYVSVFQRENNVWIQKGDIINGFNDNETMGFSVSLSDDGKYLGTGRPKTIEVGSATIFFLNSDTDRWQSAGEKTARIRFQNFGSSVSLSSDGSIFAVGAGGTVFNVGIVTNPFVGVYRRNSQRGLTQIGENITDGTNLNESGRSVSLSADGSILAIGNPLNDEKGTNVGRVKIFQNINDTWIQIGDTLYGENENDQFGRAVSINADGTLLAIGSPSNFNNPTRLGLVKVFAYKNNVWTQIGSDITGDHGGDLFGFSVSLSSDGNRLAVGSRANGTNNNSGYVKVFEKNNDSWSQLGENITGTGSEDGFGYSTSLNANGNILAIGAFADDSNGTDSGQVQIYTWNPSLSVDENEYFTNEIAFYPNPANERLHLAISQKYVIKQIKIYNVLGNLVFQNNLEKNNRDIDISSLPKGTYFLSFNFGESVFHRKFIKI